MVLEFRGSNRGMRYIENEMFFYMRYRYIRYIENKMD